MRQTVKKQMARLLAVLLVGILLSALYLPASVSAAEGGTCGPSLTWHYAAGTLTIRGEGAMEDYYDGVLPPWYHLADQITRVILPEGLTVIGRQAFFNCTSLTTVFVPDSVRVIGDKAFYNCEKLRYIELSDRLSTIGDAAFFGCRKLTAVTIPDTVEEIGAKAFYLCESLVSLVIPQSSETVGDEAFAYCTSLLRVKIKAPLRVIPPWTFYGCYSLVEIELPSTISAVEDYAFRKCEALSTVYHSGESKTVNAIRQDIAVDLPNFSTIGYVGNGVLSDTTGFTQIEFDTDDTVLSQTDTKVLAGDAMALITEVTVRPATEDRDGGYDTVLTLIVSDTSAWETVESEIDLALRAVNEGYAPYGKEQTAKLTVYVSSGSAVDRSFVQSLAGRKIETEIVTADGSAWRLDCENLKAEDVSETVDYSYRIDELDDKIKEALGGADGYRVSFNESTKIKSEVMIQLPAETAGNNAFLYQIEKNGSQTRLQAVEVDDNGTAHFYLASVDKDTTYVIGVNVPGEKTHDVILSPDRLTQNSIQRLEQIEYVTTGARTLRGMTLADMMLIVLGILVAISVIVGIIMYRYNKKASAKTKSMPAFDR